jgi:hypothetical protein
MWLPARSSRALVGAAVGIDGPSTFRCEPAERDVRCIQHDATEINDTRQDHQWSVRSTYLLVESWLKS